MTAHLETNTPRRRQYRTPRRATPTGCIVVHTAENLPDTIGADGGAEAVARFIQNRTDPGSYHVLADSDSWVHLVPFSAEAFGDGTGSNPWAIHVSVATTAALWPRKTRAWRDGAVEQLAQATAVAVRWLKAVHGIDVPARRITRAQSEAGEAGFIGHGERDPARRSDPGVGFPWGQYLDRVDQLTRPAPKPDPEDDDMPTVDEITEGIRKMTLRAGGNQAKDVWQDTNKQTEMTVRRLDTVIAQNSALLSALREAHAAGLDVAAIEAAAERGAASALATLKQDEVTA